MKLASLWFWVALFAAFFMFGLYVHSRLVAEGGAEVFGLDYATFMAQMRDTGWIVYTGFRHPGLGLVLSPVVVVAATLQKLGSRVCDIFIVGVMALTGVVNVWLVKRIAGWLAAGLFLVFGFTWVLAAVPESFPFSMTCLLLAAMLCKQEDSIDTAGSGRIRFAAWIALALVTSAVTVTNGLKIVIAFAVCNWRGLKSARVRFGAREIPLWTLLLLGCAALVLVFAGFFAVRMATWNAAHPGDEKSIAVALEQTASWIPRELGILGRLKGAAVGFAAIPLLPRFSFASLACPTTPSALGYMWSFGWIALAMAFAVALWRTKVVRAMIGMFAVDVFIHVVCGWGLAEGWVFCAHWFWMVPVLVGLYVGRRMRL